MSTPSRNIRARGGFTLVESLIAVTLLAVLFLAVAQTSSRASDAFDEGSAEHALSTGTHRCLERIVRAIEFSNGSLLANLPEVPNEQESALFATPGPFDVGGFVWEAETIFAELDEGELADGADNDGDGLIDEMQVVHVMAPGTAEERRVVLASGVAPLLAGELANGADDNGNGLLDEAGLSFSREGDVVHVRLTCQRRDEGGRLLSKTAETSVRLYNSGV
jgi:prepilin-type N-terminal cleavage/methylation domain-containing protein